MKKQTFTYMAIFLSIFLLFCWAEKSNSQEYGAVIEAIGDNGVIDWTNGILYVKGMGAPPENAVNDAQKKLLARRAAQADGYRILLEVIKGVRVESETTVEKFIVTNDTIRANVEGLVKGAQTVNTEYQPDGSAVVTLGIPLNGEAGLSPIILPVVLEASYVTPPMPPPSSVVAQPPEENLAIREMQLEIEALKERISALEKAIQELQQIIMQQKQTPTQKTEGRIETPKAPETKKEPERTTDIPPKQVTGVVIDTVGLKLKPSMSPKVFTNDQTLVYGLTKTDRKIAENIGLVVWEKDINVAQKNERVKVSPVIIKAMGISEKTNIIISPTDAQKIKEIDEKAKLLTNCKVAVVID
jgi:hypothetical protein